MEHIPITFEYRGKYCHCYLYKVAGVGDSGQWYLMDNKNYYLGMLHFNSFVKGWVFHENAGSKGFSELSQYLGDYLTAWYQ